MFAVSSPPSDGRRAEKEAIRAEERRREAEARRQADDRTEADRVEAQRRRVVVKPYEPEMANPLSERGVHPFAHLAGAISQAVKGDAA